MITRYGWDHIRCDVTDILLNVKPLPVSNKKKMNQANKEHGNEKKINQTNKRHDNKKCLVM